MSTLSALYGTTTRTDDWRHRAACLRVDPELFFPSVDEKGIRLDSLTAHRAYEEPKAICKGCPVAVQCLDAAMQCESGAGRYGVFGGLTPAERRLMDKEGLTADEAIQQAHESPRFAPDHWRYEALMVPCLRCDHCHSGRCECGCLMAMRRRNLAACGTTSGYDRHRKQKTAVCEPCRDANRAASKQASERKRQRQRQSDTIGRHDEGPDACDARPLRPPVSLSLGGGR
jgi:WhiB family redox-sensing transcriptional regulator